MNSLRRDLVARGFTLLEVLITMAIISLLAVGSVASYRFFLTAGRKGRSIQNLRQLAVANQAYAADHNNLFCPAQDRRNRVRWHGGRGNTKVPFDPTQGFLSPYLGDGQQLEMCPQFREFVKGGRSFEDNSGGYGYNAAYVGGTPGSPYVGAPTDRVSSNTVMFATTALAKMDGVQEYPFCEPFYSPTPNGGMGESLQPSVHFRFNGKALVAWCSGRISEELPGDTQGPNFYGGDSKKEQIGWFGPPGDNGYWNPNSLTAREPGH